MRYFPRQKSEFWVEVVIAKQKSAMGTQKYCGLELVCSAQGDNFHTTMIHSTLRGLKADEPIDIVDCPQDKKLSFKASRLC
jgi:hypothetical protein